MIDADFDALLEHPNLSTDTNTQEMIVRRLIDFRMASHAAAPSMLQRASRALDVHPDRLAAICELEDPIDRRQALKVRRRIRMATRLPDEAMYPEAGWIGSYLRWAEHMEVPLAWHFWAGLTVLAACCRRNFYTHSGAYPIWPSLYTVLVGPSGEGKSLCMQSAARPMIEAVNRRLRASRDPEARIDDTINLVPDRITVASFLDKAAIGYTVAAEKEVDPETGKTKRVRAQNWRRKDSATMILKDELCAFIGKDSLDAGAWIELLLDISNGADTYINPTQVKTRTLEGVSLTCLFGSAEENLRKGMPPTFLQGGMMGRCMWIHRLTSGRIYPTLSPLDPIVREDLAEWLVRLTRQPSREILRHPETESWWTQFYHEWAEQKEMQPEFRSWHNRLKDQILRIAMLLALSSGRFEIRLADLELALEVLNAERERFAGLFQILSLSREGETNDVVLRAIPSSPDWITEGQLASKLQNRIGSLEQLSRSLAMLVRGGSVRLEKRRRDRAGMPPIIVCGYQRISQRRERI